MQRGRRRRKGIQDGEGQSLLLQGLSINKKQSMPAYLQLKERLSQAIESGELPAGAALPSERDLAETLHLSRMTVRRALEELVVDNLVERRQGSGTYVLPRRMEQTIDHIAGFSEEARLLGFKAGSKLIEAQLVPADQQVADILGMEKGDMVFRITRLRTADGAPLALQFSHISPRLKDFPVEKLRKSGSLYKTIAQHYHISPVKAHQTVSARLPLRLECQQLEISREIPLLSIERVTYDDSGKPFEYVRSAYRGDKYQIGLDIFASS